MIFAARKWNEALVHIITRKKQTMKTLQRFQKFQCSHCNYAGGLPGDREASN